MHDCPETDVGAELTLGATLANRLYLTIHQRLAALARHPAPAIAVFDAELAPLYRNLAVTEVAMWRHVAPYVDTAESSASDVARLLRADLADVGAITANAAMVNTALSMLTSLQRDVLLSRPLIALANNVAMDCETEFDNETALARWRAQLERARPGISSQTLELTGKGEGGLAG